MIRLCLEALRGSRSSSVCAGRVGGSTWVEYAFVVRLGSGWEQSGASRLGLEPVSRHVGTPFCAMCAWGGANEGVCWVRRQERHACCCALPRLLVHG